MLPFFAITFRSFYGVRFGVSMGFSSDILLRL